MSNADSEHNWARNIFRNAPVGMLVVNNRIITKVNKIFCKLSGYSENELVGQSTEIGYFDKTEFERVGQILYDQIGKTGYGNAEARLKHKDGSIINVLISSSISNGSLHDGDIVFAVIDITDRIIAGKKLKEEKEFTETAINAQIDTLFIFEPSTGRLIRWNKAFSRLSGYSDEEIASMRAPDDWYDKEDLKKAANSLDTISRDGRATIEMSLITKDGQRILTEYQASYITDAEGNPKYIIAIGRDITQRRQTEKKLVREQYFSESLIQTSPAYFVAIDAEGKTKVMNQTMLKALGYTSEEAIGTDYIKVFVPDKDRQILYGIFSKLINLNEPTISENSILTKDGRELLVEWHGQPVYDADGRFDFFFGVGIDITKRKQAEEEAKKFKTISDQANYGTAIADLEGNIIYLNECFASMHGLAIEETIGKHLSIFHTDEQMPMVNRLNKELIKNGYYPATEVWHKKNDGSVFPTMMNATIITDEDNKQLFISASAVDITERKQAEEALQQSEAHLQSIFRAAPTGIGVVVNRVIKQVNERMCEITGYSQEELVGKNARMLYVSDADFEYVGREKYAQINNHGTGTVETRFQCKDGRVIDVLLSSTPLDANDLSKGVTFTALDITERKQAEMKLRESEEKLSKAFYLSPDSISITLLETGKLIDINKGFEDLFGYGRDEVIGESTIKLGLWKNLSDRGKMVEAVKRDGRMRNFEAVGKSKSGDTFIGDVSSEIIEINEEKCLITVVRDITERKRAEEALRERERTLDALINAPTEVAILIDTKGKVLAINRIGAQRFGKKENEIIGMSIYDYLPPKIAKSRKASGSQVIRTGKPIRFQDEREGRYFDNNIYPVFDDKGKVSALAINTRDITRHRQAEIILRSLVEGTAKATGQDFFNKLVEHLATALNCRYAFISILDDSEPKQITTLSYWDKNKIGENFSFDVTGTPCEDVGKKNICFYQSQVSKKYPKDKWLIKNKIEAYLGVPILDSKRDPIGILVIMNTRRFSDDLIDGAHSLMAIFASRAAAEIKRISAEDELRAIADRLREEQKALFDKHVALKQILDHMESEKLDFRHEISSSIEQVLMPFSKKLRKKDGAMSEKDMELFEDAIKSITGIGIDDFKANYAKLTSREMDVCDLIKEGKSSQEIADTLHLSLQTIQKHRSSIRRKLQLKNKNINLPAYLRYK